MIESSSASAAAPEAGAAGEAGEAGAERAQPPPRRGLEERAWSEREAAAAAAAQVVGLQVLSEACCLVQQLHATSLLRRCLIGCLYRALTGRLCSRALIESLNRAPV